MWYMYIYIYVSRSIYIYTVYILYKTVYYGTHGVLMVPLYMDMYTIRYKVL